MNILSTTTPLPADFNPAWDSIAAVCDALAHGFNTAHSFPPFRMGGAK